MAETFGLEVVRPAFSDKASGQASSAVGRFIQESPEFCRNNDRAAKLVEQQKYEQAERLYRSNVSYQTSKYRDMPTEPNLEKLNESRKNLAHVLMSQSEFSEADQLLRKCFADLEAQSRGFLRDEDVLKLGKNWFTVENERAKLEQVDNLFAKHATQVRREIRTYGTDPKSWLVSAMKKNRVLTIGEDHVYAGTSRHHELGSSLMGALKDAGATHLAVELPSSRQDMLERFSRTGSMDESSMESSKGTNEFISTQKFLKSPDLINVLTAAREVGLKLVAVDDANNINVGPYNGVFGTGRDKAMAASIANILNSDPKTKFVYWVGATHAEVTVDQRDHERACQILRKQRYGVCSVLPKEKQLDSDNNPLFALTGDVKQPTLVPMSKARTLSRLPELKTLFPSTQNFGAWDAVIIYPTK